jgi:hypothetical protein
MDNFDQDFFNKSMKYDSYNFKIFYYQHVNLHA